MPNIALRSVEKSYDGHTNAVSELTLEIEDGDFMCLLGPSGCGKTTTLRMIAGLENLSGGEVRVGESIVDSVNAGVFVPPERRGMGLVFQSYALWPHLTVERNTDFGLRLQRIPKAEREARVSHVMQTLGIEAYRDRYPSQLSGGQQQRVALARMLAVKPDVLLLDEPLSNLDARLRLEMRAELKRIHREFGATIVFVTHDQWEAMTLATRIAVMHDGRLQQVGSPDDIYGLPANRFVAEFVGSPPINIVEIHEDRPGGLSEAAREVLARIGPSAAAAASVGLRPEGICLGSGPDSSRTQICARASVAAILPTGGSWIVELDVSGQTLFATTNSAPRYELGAEIDFHTIPTAVHIFDGRGERINLGDKVAEDSAA